MSIMQGITWAVLHHIKGRNRNEGSVGLRNEGSQHRREEKDSWENGILDKADGCQACRATGSDCRSGKEGSGERSFRGKKS